MRTNVLPMSLTGKHINMNMVANKRCVFERDLAYRVDEGGRVCDIHSMEEFAKEMARDGLQAFSFKGMEMWSPEVWDFCNTLTHATGYKPISARLHYANASAYSSGEQVIKHDTYLYVLEGRQHVLITKSHVAILNGESVTEFTETENVIEEGFYLFIPAGTKIRIVNKEYSEMLSIYVEKWIKDEA